MEYRHSFKYTQFICRIERNERVRPPACSCREGRQHFSPRQQCWRQQEGLEEAEKSLSHLKKPLQKKRKQVKDFYWDPSMILLGVVTRTCAGAREQQCCRQNSQDQPEGAVKPSTSG